MSIFNLFKTEWKTMDSEAIKKVKYDKKNEMLFVTFSGGKTYTYGEVSNKEWKGLLNADSKGRFINKAIKPNHTCWKLVKQA